MSRVANIRRSGQYLPHDLTLDSVAIDRKERIHGWCCITSDLEPKSWADMTVRQENDSKDTSESVSTDWPTQSDTESSTSTAENEPIANDNTYDPALLDLNRY